ncbi:MAG: DsrE family protein [bacterium]
MSENQEMILYIATFSGDNAEKAAVPFVLGGAALAMDIKAVIVLQGEAVYLAKPGYVDTMKKPGGFPPVKKLLADFLELGGELKVCGPCIKDRGIEESGLIEGASVTAAGQVNLLALKADAVMTF